MKRWLCFRAVRCAFIVMTFFTLVLACRGPSQDVITKQDAFSKQREGLIYQVSYQKAFQCVIFTLTKKGIAIDKIDEKKGFITTLPQQVRAEKYAFQIAIRTISVSETAISVICTWSVPSGIDIKYAFLPSTVARSKSKKLEIELAEDISKEITKEEAEKSKKNEI